MQCCLPHRFIDEARISPFSDDAVIKTIPLSSFPADLYLVVRTLMLLRGLCFSLDLDYNVRILSLRRRPHAIRWKPGFGLKPTAPTYGQSCNVGHNSCLALSLRAGG